jgi:L-rhamnose isomerase / sugar isomerase
MGYADPRDAGYIASANQTHAAALAADYAHLGAQLERRGIRIDDITRAVANFRVAIPSWGVGTGGTRFGRFPGIGEPRNVFEKLEDCAVIHKLTGATPTVSLHIPWDRTDDWKALRERGAALGLGFDAMN